ncbi:MAG: hypothetical protein K2R93_05145 [Gemmatimonadaceae bacterium]|nr:hypothetical protein [Gemmatimonadaceae bacterium]
MSPWRRQWSRLRTPLLILSAVGTAVFAAACTEELEGGAACPTLCPTRAESFKDTTFEAVSLDTALSGYPVMGLAPELLLANRPDTLVTRMVIRVDGLTQEYAKNKTGATEPISNTDSVYLRLTVDSLGAKGTDSVTISLFNVDTTANDSVSTVVKRLFTPRRLIGSLRVVPKSVKDSLRIPIDRRVMDSLIVGGYRLRVGLQITAGKGQLRLLAFSSGAAAPSVQYDPSTDTTYAPIIVPANTSIPQGTTEQILAYTVYNLLDVGSPPPPTNTLTVGGFPAWRSYLRFQIPARISDSSTIVRAQLLLTQRPSYFGNFADSVALLPIIPTGTALVTDLRRLLDLSADGVFASVDSTRLVPRDSGVKSINVLTLARSWPALPSGVARSLAFRISGEGAQPAELRFFSSEAPVGLRPRLRITYLPRTEFALP